MKVKPTPPPLFKANATHSAEKKNAYLNFEQSLASNPLGERVAIDLVGDATVGAGVNLLVGRGIFPSLERFGDIAAWAVFGILMPLLVIKHGLVAPGSPFTKGLKRLFSFSNASPLKTSFSMLNEDFLHGGVANQQKLMKHLGLTDKSKLLPLAREIRKGKMFAILVDMLGLASFSASFFPLRNWLTQVLSGKKGFSGEFNYANDDYIKKKSSEFEKNEKQRHLLGIISGYVGNLAVTALTWFTLNSKGNDMFKSLRRFIPALDYHQGIFMSPLLLFMHILGNYNMKSIFFFSRDKNEMIEEGVRSLVFDFVSFLGDGIVSGLCGQYFQKKHAAELGGAKLTKPWILGIERAKPIQDIQAEFAGNLKKLEIGEKCARTSFRAGLLTASVVLGVSLTFIRAALTRLNIASENGQKKSPENPTLANNDASKTNTN